MLTNFDIEQTNYLIYLCIQHLYSALFTNKYALMR